MIEKNEMKRLKRCRIYVENNTTCEMNRNNQSLHFQITSSALMGSFQPACELNEHYNKSLANTNPIKTIN